MASVVAPRCTIRVFDCVEVSVLSNVDPWCSALRLELGVTGVQSCRGAAWTPSAGEVALHELVGSADEGRERFENPRPGAARWTCFYTPLTRWSWHGEPLSNRCRSLRLNLKGLRGMQPPGDLGAAAAAKASATVSPLQLSAAPAGLGLSVPAGAKAPAVAAAKSVPDPKAAPAIPMMAAANAPKAPAVAAAKSVPDPRAKPDPGAASAVPDPRHPLNLPPLSVSAGSADEARAQALAAAKVRGAGSGGRVHSPPL